MTDEIDRGITLEELWIMVDQRDKALESYRHAHAQDERTLSDRDKTIAEQRVMISDLRIAVTGSDKTIESLRATINNRDETIASLRELLAEKETEIRDQRRRRDVTYSDLRELISLRNQEIADWTAAGQRDATTIASLRAQIAQDAREIDARDETLSFLNEGIAERDETIADLRAGCGEFRAGIASRDRDIATMHGTITSLAVDLREGRRILAAILADGRAGMESDGLEIGESYGCIYCGVSTIHNPEETPVPHTPECVLTIARAFVDRGKS